MWNWVFSFRVVRWSIQLLQLFCPDDHVNEKIWSMPCSVMYIKITSVMAPSSPRKSLVGCHFALCRSAGFINVKKNTLFLAFEVLESLQLQIWHHRQSRSLVESSVPTQSQFWQALFCPALHVPLDEPLRVKEVQDEEHSSGLAPELWRNERAEISTCWTLHF